MKKIFILPIILVFTLISCNKKQENNDIASGSGDEAFLKLSEEYITKSLEWNPQTGVYLGLHEYDGRLGDFSKPNIDKRVTSLKKFDQEFSAIDSTTLSKRNYYDWKIIKSNVKNELFSFEDLKPFTKNPMVYAGAIDVNIYIQRNFAPIEQQIKSIIAIEKSAPKFFENAKANLQDSLALPHIKLAIDIARGSASFLGKDLLVALKNVKNDSLMKSFNETNQKAIASINDFAAFLEKEKLPKANNKYAIGVENYKKMLLYQEEIKLSPDEILAIGLKELKKEQASFNAAAKIINPNKKPIDVYNEMQKEHPTAQDLIPHARKNIEAIRQYLIDHKIVTMPSEVRVKIQETPAYARATSTASMDSPGPFETKATQAFYYITPVDPKWTPKQQEDWLAQFNFYTTDIVSIHEAYPGHYTQFLHSNASKTSKIQKIFMSYAYVEGWAHYTEKMMIDEGYGNTGDPIKAAKYRLAQSGDALLRICRLCVSINTHCHGMNVDDATKFFMNNWYQGDKPSRQEALRGTYDPGYLFYTLGKLQILKLREDYKKQEGSNYNLQKFNDAMLDNGMPPIQILREILLKDEKIWGAIL
ncbi:DUF885 domain-containing protein [Flavobacterium sp. CF136]|uniref:DUF885 domain-containing protein n=1 Tax=Flavobacterium sp. (strain CF136) TaxID=1144313 RepID=UPI000271B949|nr:DUF885 domain-containing protein [Flavobacterium sp. CF136]EJL62398.1 hypothetical protein PMI10_02937 [Flavobacterium sp. CF136]